MSNSRKHLEKTYIRVSLDKYRFIEDMGTAKELAEKYHTTVNSIQSTACKVKNGGRLNGRWEVVDI